MAIDSYAAKWRQIPEHPDYEVSSEGRVRRCTPAHNGKPVPYELNLAKDAYGYPQASLWCPRRKRFVTKKVHRLVLRAFVGEPPTPKHEGAHGNGDRSDNRLANLRWASPKENREDAIEHGTWLHGSRHPLSKLSEDVVRKLRAMPLKRGEQRRIAKALGVSPGVVCEAISGKTWAHVSKQEVSK